MAAQGNPVEAVVKGSLAFSGDSKRLAYVAQEGNQHFAVIDGRRGSAFDEIRQGTVAFSPDGRRAAYVGRRRNNGRWSSTSRRGPSSPRSAPVFSPDGRHVAYVGHPNGRAFVMLDGREGPLYSSVLGNVVTFRPEDGVIEYLSIGGDALLRVRQSLPS